jgi:hypothetical protein
LNFSLTRARLSPKNARQLLHSHPNRSPGPSAPRGPTIRVQFALSRENSGTVCDERQACHALNRRFDERIPTFRRRCGRIATLPVADSFRNAAVGSSGPRRDAGSVSKRLDRGIPVKGGPRIVESAASGPQRTRLVTAYRAPKGARVRVVSRTVSEETRSRPSTSDLDPSVSLSRRSAQGSPKRPDVETAARETGVSCALAFARLRQLTRSYFGLGLQ